MLAMFSDLFTGNFWKYSKGLLVIAQTTVYHEGYRAVGKGFAINKQNLIGFLHRPQRRQEISVKTYD
jgi:hypothetical protein